MNGISGIGGNMGFMQAMPRPDPSEMAQELFARLDTSGQGYIEKSDLQSALTKVSSTSETSTTDTDQSDIDELFAQLDSDSNGKITEQELSDSLTKIDEQINALFSQMRMNQAQGQMMPPPPPPDGEMGMDDASFTEEELIAQLDEIGDSDTARSTLIETIIANFDEADTDGDGEVSHQEAMTYDQSANASTGSSETITSDTSAVNDKVMLQIMRLVQAYSLGGEAENQSASLNVTT
jgi:Ca2+-binding EF-hand superfamily protein